MKFGVLITNNADRHPPLKWAQVTADRVMSVFDPEEKDVQALLDKREFESRLIKLLNAHYAMTQQREVDVKPTEHFAIAHSDIIEMIIADIREAAKINPVFAAWFANVENMAHVRANMLHVDMQSIVHLERQKA
jgi:hypothetical protein